VYITGAVPANLWTSVFDTAVVPQLGVRKIAVFYKIVNLTPMHSVRAVRFLLGATGASALGVFHTEEFTLVKLTPEVYLSEPIVYSPQEFVNIQCYAQPAIPAAGERLGFGCFIAEPAGEVVS